MRTLLIASAFAAALASIGVADTQTYPSHPITLIIPLLAGSAFDVTAWIVAGACKRPSASRSSSIT
jgi:tripartite-type tricarboxylate transporter receptor subunit TctC